MINLRRNPWLAVALMASGGIALGVGLFFNEYVVVALGVMLFGGGGLTMLNPAVTIEADKVVLKNLLGLPAASYDHDGIPELSIVDGKLLIRYKGRQAIINKVAKSRLHKGDWEVLVRSLAELSSRKKPVAKS